MNRIGRGQAKGAGWIHPSCRRSGWSNSEALERARELKSNGYMYRGEVFDEPNEDGDEMTFRALARDHTWVWGYLEINTSTPYPERGGDTEVIIKASIRPASRKAAVAVEKIRGEREHSVPRARLARFVVAAMSRCISMQDLGIADDDELLAILDTADEDVDDGSEGEE